MEPNDVRAVIEAHNRDLESWYALGKVEKVIQVFAEDAWQMPPNAPALQGRGAIRGFWKEAVRWGDWDFHLDTQQVMVSEPIAVERGTYRLNFEAGKSAPPDMPSFEDHGNYVVVWRKEPDGSWRILWDAPVSEVPVQ